MKDYCTKAHFLSFKDLCSHPKRLFCAILPEMGQGGLVKRLRNSSKVSLSPPLNERNGFKFIKDIQDILEAG